MDYYKKIKKENSLMVGGVILGIILQVYGHKKIGPGGLLIQLVSLALLLLILYFYNKREK